MLQTRAYFAPIRRPTCRGLHAQDDAIARLACTQAVERPVDFRDGELLGLWSWQAANSSISAMVAGEPLGEPETLRWVMIMPTASIGIGSSTAPTKCSRPRGRKVASCVA